MKPLTPFGIRDLIPSETKDLSLILDKTKGAFESHGYQHIITPSLDYYETLEKGLSETLKSKAVKLFDRLGHLLVLRPDHTTPIARLVATRLTQETMPLRLYYQDVVFRWPHPPLEDVLETFQVGCELIGEKGPSADAEMIATCIDALRALGIKTFGLDLGHTDFGKSISGEDKAALLNSDYVSFDSLPTRGGVEVVQDFPELIALYHHLEKGGYQDHITFNRGLIKDAGYYSGLVFDVYVQGIGQVVGSGGRYDQLISQFGADCPAVGFALNASALLGIVQPL